jgi:hypothetical protein
MIPGQNPNLVVALDNTVVTTTTTYSFGPRIDTINCDVANFVIFGGGAASGTNGYIAATIQEADATTTASFADISGYQITATQWTAATASTAETSAAQVPVGFISLPLLGRKRYIRIGLRAHSSATAQVGKVVCLMENRVTAGTATGALFNIGTA